MRASRSFVSLCQISLVTIAFSAGLTMAGCGSDTAAPKSTSGQAPAQAAPAGAVQDKGKAKGKPQIETRRDLHKARDEASKDSQ